MSRAKQPVSIAGVEFDALINATETLEADAPAYPIETGYEISDSIIIKQKKLEMTLFISGSPVTWRNRLTGGESRVTQVVKQLKDAYYSKALVTVSTTDETYTDMAIISIAFTKTTEVGYAMEIPIVLVQVSTTSTATTTIPDSYGKSGATGASAGSASTTNDTVSGSGASGSAGSTDSGKSGSILYGLATDIGLL